MKSIGILSFLLLIVFASCTKTQNATTHSTDTTMVGNWRWVAYYSDGAPGPTNPATPQNSGASETFTFNANATWTDVKNNATIGSGTYTLGLGATYDSINFYGTNGALTSVTTFTRSNDTLVFLGAPRIVGAGAKYWVK